MQFLLVESKRSFLNLCLYLYYFPNEVTLVTKLYYFSNEARKLLSNRLCRERNTIWYVLFGWK